MRRPRAGCATGRMRLSMATGDLTPMHHPPRIATGFTLWRKRRQTLPAHGAARRRSALRPHRERPPDVQDGTPALVRPCEPAMAAGARQDHEIRNADRRQRRRRRSSRAGLRRLDRRIHLSVHGRLSDVYGRASRFTPFSFKEAKRAAARFIPEHGVRVAYNPAKPEMSVLVPGVTGLGIAAFVASLVPTVASLIWLAMSLW